MAEGYGVQRFDVMYNDFVIVGPSEDPPGWQMPQMRPPPWPRLQGQKRPSPRAAMIAARMWPRRTSGRRDVEPAGEWYLSTGSGMGATLNTAAQVPAYALTDRGTWLSPFQKPWAVDDQLRGRPGAVQPLMASSL